MDIFSTLLNVPILQAIGVVLLIGIAERMGVPVISIFKSLFKVNGNGKEMTALKEQLDLLENNHLSHLESKLDKIVEQNQEILLILRDLKRK